MDSELAARPQELAARILVVDDAPDVRHIHARLLSSYGGDVLTAENGTLALAAARRLIPDVVVTDVHMPVMDGLDLCRHLRADAATRSVVVVVVTGDSLVIGRAAFEAGCDAVLQKPCPGTLLRATIQGLLDRRTFATGNGA